MLKKRLLAILLCFVFLFSSADVLLAKTLNNNGEEVEEEVKSLDKKDDVLTPYEDEEKVKENDVEAQEGKPLENLEGESEASETTPFSNGVLDVVYLNGGSEGDDANSGETSETAVKTFGKAKELLKPGGDIAVVGAINIGDENKIVEEIWELPKGSKIVRGKDSYGNIYSGNIVQIQPGSKLTLNNITIDGSGEYTNMSPLIDLYNGELILEENAILENNNGSAIEVFSDYYDGDEGNSLLTINGGIIRSNNAQYGSAIYASGEKTKVVMNDGSIENNTYTPDNIYNYNDAGGTVYISVGAEFEMNGGAIQNNKYETIFEEFDYDGNPFEDIDIRVVSSGGGVILSRNGSGGGGNSSGKSVKFTMKGGTIKNNEASKGGGIFIEKGSDVFRRKRSTDFDKAKLPIFIMNGGSIEGNKSKTHYEPYDIYDYDQKILGGGGIYLEAGEVSILGNSVIKDNGSFDLLSDEKSFSSGIYVKNFTDISDGEYDEEGNWNGYIYNSTKFNLGGSPNIDSNNDVFLDVEVVYKLDEYGHPVHDDEGNPIIEGYNPAVIEVVEEYNGEGKQIQLTTPAVKIEDINPSLEDKMGWKLVHYSEAAGGAKAAKKAMEEKYFVVSEYHKDEEFSENEKREEILLYEDGIPKFDKNKYVVIASDYESNYLVHGPAYGVRYDANGGIGTLIDLNSPYPKGLTVKVLGQYGPTYRSGSSSNNMSVVGMSALSLGSENNATLRQSGITREGYKFTGWNTAANGSGTPYSAGETFTITEDVILYAQWKKVEEPEKPTSINPWFWMSGEDDLKHYAYMVGYPDGTVQPEGEITRAEVVTIFFRMITDEKRNEFWSVENSYTDVNSTDWYNNAISTMTKAGVINGYENGSFKPDESISRGEFAAMASRFLSDRSSLTNNKFTDIKGNWAEVAIGKLAAEGHIKGYEDGSFKPEQKITRAEAATLVNSILERTPEKDRLHADMKTWVDNADKDKWYYAQVQEATNSHEYERVNVTNFEIWKKILPVRDWAALELEWSTANSASGTGSVIEK